MTEFLHMGGYAFFVWTSYIVAILLLIAMYLQPLWKQRSLRRYFRQKFHITGQPPRK